MFCNKKGILKVTATTEKVNMTTTTETGLKIWSNNEGIFIRDGFGPDPSTTSGIEYIFIKGTEAWIKWGEYSYLYEMDIVTAFQALKEFFENESLGKLGNFIKREGKLEWADSDTAREKIGLKPMSAYA